MSIEQERAETHQTWKLRDIIRAPAISLDLEKLLTGAAGLFLAALVFGVLYWLGVKTGERAALRVFTVVGAILASCIWVLFAGIIAKMNLTQLLEGRKAGAAEIRMFIQERWMTLMGTPIAFGTLGLLLLGFMALLQLIGSLPGLGPILFSASFLLAFFLAFMATLTAVVHTLGAFLYPSIVALKGAGAVGVIIEMFEIVRRRGFHLLLYEAFASLVGLAMTVLMGALSWAGLYITIASAQVIMDEKFDSALSAIPEYFRVFIRPFEGRLPPIPEAMEVSWHYDFSGFLLGLSLLCVVVGTAVYPFVLFNTAGSITYLIIREGPDERTTPGPV